MCTHTHIFTNAASYRMTLHCARFNFAEAVYVGMPLCQRSGPIQISQSATFFPPSAFVCLNSAKGLCGTLCIQNSFW